MATNPNAPTGFRYIGKRDGTGPNFGSRTGQILSGNTNKIFTGDVLKPTSAGFLDVYTTPVVGGEPIGGVAGWFVWSSVSQNKTVFQNWWPGNGDATGNVVAHYYADDDAIFQVQCTLGPVTQASVGLTANFSVGGGGQQVGAGNNSSFSLDDSTLTANGPAMPFKVYSLANSSTNPIYTLPGFDPASAYNQIFVTINNLVA